MKAPIIQLQLLSRLMIDINIKNIDVDEFLDEYNSKEHNNKLHLKFDMPRREVLTSWKDVQACPGSGKTTLVAAKLIMLSKKWTNKHKGICVLTHTNVACDEIKTKLLNHPSAYKLTTYPHFIGTIQEFINRFLAIPYLRTSDFTATTVNRIDDEVCVAFMTNFINQGTRNYLERKRASLFDLKIEHTSGNINIPAFKSTSESPTYRNLEEALFKRIDRGFFFYSEMYYFANQCISENKEITKILSKRFPIVLIDEMQDTQEFQDELINLIFDNDNVKIQRLGDPDQAIFDNMGGELPNESFNKNPKLLNIHSTHRFPKCITSKIHGLSVTQAGEINSCLPKNIGKSYHTVIVYNDNSIPKVLDCFADIIATQDSRKQWHYLKAVGATEGMGGYISAYWSLYSKKKSIKRPRPEKLIHVVTRNWKAIDMHSSIQYVLLLNCILDVLRLSGTKDSRTEPNTYFSTRNLISWLNENNKFICFRKLLTKWILQSKYDKTTWNIQCNELKKIIPAIDTNTEVKNYLSYDTIESIDKEVESSISNIYEAENGRKIEVATIHSIKGETHDATLVLETKFHEFDINTLINNISYTDNKKITAIRKSKFARQLYVAMSRPRHLLCLATHENHITDSQLQALEAIGWNISVI